MAARRKRKPSLAVIAGFETVDPKRIDRLVHDRRAMELPKDAMVAPVIVDDPYEQGAKVIAFQNIRDSPLSYMRARGQIDEAQYNAGRQMQVLYERSEIGALRGIDPTKEAVDGGMMAETLTEGVQKAIQEIIRLERALGAEGAALARHVLCQGFSIQQCAEVRQMTGKLHTKYIGIRFREVLETLAVELNLVGR